MFFGARRGLKVRICAVGPRRPSSGDDAGRIPMLKSNTVFVLGAAFSAELGLPLGGTLKDQISRLLPRQGSPPSDEIFSELVDTYNAYTPAFRALQTALPLAASIDNLVEHRGGDEQFVTAAKWAIARAIAKAEVGSPLGPKARSGLPADNSYAALFQLIVSGVPRERMALAFSRLHVVTFNYDRTLEVYLHRAIQTYSGVNSEAARDILNEATIVHAYGALGASDEGSVRPTQFREDRSWRRIVQDAQGLRTFSEKEDSQSIEVVRQEIQQAMCLVVLGCAFHPQNLRLITPEVNRLTSIYATAYSPPPKDSDGFAAPSFERFSLQQAEVLKAAIRQWPAQHPHVSPSDRLHFHLEAMTCRQLIQMYGADWRE